GDYLTDNLDARGCLLIASGDTMSPDPVTGGPRAWSLPVFIQQTAGPLLTHGTCGGRHSRGALIGGFGQDLHGGPGAVLVLGAVLLGVAVNSRRPLLPALA